MYVILKPISAIFLALYSLQTSIWGCFPKTVFALGGHQSSINHFQMWHFRLGNSGNL